MDSDDDGDLRTQAFIVGGCPDQEFDLDIPPTSGQEYLRRVRMEASQCPQIVVAQLDTATFQEKPSMGVASCGLQPAPQGYAPNGHWQKQQQTHFAQIRQKLACYKARRKKEGTKSQIELPEKGDRESWCRLCFGRTLSSEDKQSEDNSSSTDTVSKNDNETNTQDTSPATPTPPLLSIVTQMDQPTLAQVLEYHIKWFEATGFSKEQGQWFYALLACLEKPLSPEMFSLLRSLARNAANLRATLDSTEDEHLAPLNLLICLVGRYFEQADLADTS